MPRFKPPGQCPNCGEWVPRGAVACDDCGSCAKSGWSSTAGQDGLDLPDEEFDYDDFIEREFGSQQAKPQGISWLWWVVAIVLLLSFLYPYLAPLL